MGSQHDVIIVGGGIGGSALAAVLAARGLDILLLEQTELFEDRVRGEWIAPWGVTETRRLGLYDLLVGAGGHHLTRHVTYDESRTPEEAEARTLPLSVFAAGVPGPLCLGNPLHAQTLFDEAVRRGAKGLRGASVSEVRSGGRPGVTYSQGGETLKAEARLVVGADGRASSVRESSGITLHQDRPHHWFAGLLVENAHSWPDDLQAIGTEGGGRIRLYGSYGLEQKRRFGGPDGPQAFLDAFRVQCSPLNEAIARATPAGPLLSYFNNDGWTDQPFAEGVVLIGDAAGWNDPIVGLGLSITYRDVRIVSDILAGADWSMAAFAPYAEERSERMRRLRLAASVTSTLDAEFGEAAKARRRRHFERTAEDPSLGAYGLAIMGGPEMAPPEVFTPEFRERVLETA
jgi:2-polyprenyl-6-methoxyphenol hydroxylase-like FAD-dependent oxidoreductase